MRLFNTRFMLFLFLLTVLMSLYANSNQELINEAGWRIDLIAIDIYPDGNYDLRHLENIAS